MNLRIEDVLDLTNPDVVIGKHSAWLPKLQIKTPFQFAGRVVKYRKPGEPSYPLETLVEEYALLSALAAHGWGVPVGRWVYFQMIVSEHPGGWWADPCGAYGWEMADADALPPGRFDPAAFRAWGRVEGSEGAWNDLAVPGRGNVRNGYLVDVRRSWFDRLRWLGPVGPMPRYAEDAAALEADLCAGAQFPFRERDRPYQEYRLGGRWRPGEREVVTRAGLLGFQPERGDSVVDVGCHTGGFLQYAWLRASATGPAGRMIGLDAREEYVALARRLARAGGMNLCYRVADVEAEWDALLPWLRGLCPDGVDHALWLSMTKHLRGGETALWRMVDGLRAARTYLETNAVKPGDWPLWLEAQRRGGRVMGTSTDRNARRCYRIVSAGA